MPVTACYSAGMSPTRTLYAGGSSNPQKQQRTFERRRNYRRGQCRSIRTRLQAAKEVLEIESRHLDLIADEDKRLRAASRCPEEIRR